MKNNLPKENDIPNGYVMKKREIKELIEIAKKRSIRDYKIIKLMLNCGLRREEVGKVKYSSFFQVENKDEKLEWHMKIEGKGRKQRQVFVNEELANDLELSITSKNNDDFMFCGKQTKVGLSGDRVNKIIKECAKEIGLDDISAHDLRHTNITHLAIAGVHISELQRHAGHDSVNTTMGYVNLAGVYENSAGKSVKW